MYIHQRDWQSAMAIAEKHDRDAVTEVMVQQAKDYVPQSSTQGTTEEVDLTLLPDNKTVMW